MNAIFIYFTIYFLVHPIICCKIYSSIHQFSTRFVWIEIEMVNHCWNFVVSFSIYRIQNLKGSSVFSTNFQAVDENSSLLGFAANHKKVIYMILSAVLNLGNIEFDINGDIDVNSRTFLCNAAILLKLDELNLKDVLTIHTREIGKVQIK